jgi:hypothetical protein
VKEEDARRQQALDKLRQEREEEERLLTMEFQTGQRLQQAQLQRAEQEQDRVLREALEARKRADELSDRALRERLAAEDDEARLRQQLDTARVERVSNSQCPSWLNSSILFLFTCCEHVVWLSGWLLHGAI